MRRCEHRPRENRSNHLRTGSTRPCQTNLHRRYPTTDPNISIEVRWEHFLGVLRSSEFCRLFSDAPDEQKKNGEDFPKILTRLCQSGLVSSTADHPSSTIPKETIEVVLDSDDTIAASTSTTAKANTRRSIANISEQEVRLIEIDQRIDRSLHLWCLEILPDSTSQPVADEQNEHRSRMVHTEIATWTTIFFDPDARSRYECSRRCSRDQSVLTFSPSPSWIREHRSLGDERVTTSKTDETVRQTEVQPTISWAPLTEEQAAERERQRVQMKYFDYDNLVKNFHSSKEKNIFRLFCSLGWSLIIGFGFDRNSKFLRLGEKPWSTAPCESQLEETATSVLNQSNRPLSLCPLHWLFSRHRIWINSEIVPYG